MKNEFSIGSFVYLPPMAYLDDMNDYLLINYVADYHPISDAIAPKSFQVLYKDFSLTRGLATRAFSSGEILNVAVVIAVESDKDILLSYCVQYTRRI